LRYDITFIHSNADERSVRVVMTAAATGTGSVVLSVPAWTLGAFTSRAQSADLLGRLRARRDRSPRLGGETELDGSAVTVVSVMQGSSAASAGVKRGAEALRRGGALKFANDVSIEADPVASPKAIRIRNGILKAPTGG
jgi:predicted metalloprotease with PDZ domain